MSRQVKTCYRGRKKYEHFRCYYDYHLSNSDWIGCCNYCNKQVRREAPLDVRERRTFYFTVRGSFYLCKQIVLKKSYININ